MSPSPADPPIRRPPGAPRILLVRLSAIGDCLHALPIVHELRRQIPDAFLGWAVEAAGLSLLEGHPEVDRFHRFPRGREEGGRLAALRRFRRELLEVGYDIAIDVQGLTKSGLVAWMSGADERVGFGDRDSRELNRFFLNRRLVPAPRRVHVVDRNLALLEVLGLDVPERAEWVFPPAEPRGEVARFLEAFGGERFVALNPGAAWPTKQWSVPSFGRLARRLATELGAGVAVVWGNEDERRAAEQIRDAAAAAAVRMAPRTDLGQLGALVARAELFVSGDTGPLHLAAALRVPTVALFGPTSPERNGPYGERHTAIVDEEPLECRPCWSRRCARGDLACLERIEVDRVLAACAAVWMRDSDEDLFE